VNSLVRAARRLSQSTTARSVLQQQVDRITRTDTAPAQDTPAVWDGGPRSPESGASPAGGVGAVVGSLAGGMASLKGLNELGRQLQSNGSWLDGVQQLTSQLSPNQLRTAAQEAVSSLPETVRGDLSSRLSSQVDRIPHGSANDLPGVVSGFLGQSGGAQQLLSLLAASRGGPAGAALSLMSTMKDPAVRELAKSLVSSLVSVKGRGTPG
jgi:hypothetical protein